MKRIKHLLVLLAAVFLLAGALPAPSWPGEDILTLEWVRSTESGGKVTYHSYMDPLTVDREGNVYVCNTDGYLYVYTPAKNLKWKFNLRQYSGDKEHELGLGPVLDGQGNCYIASGNQKVYKIDPDSHVLAEFQMAGEVADGASPALAPDGTLYVVTGNRILYALDSFDLSPKWWVRFAGIYSAMTPVVSPDGTVVTGSSRTVTAVDPGSREVAWEYQLPEDMLLYQYNSRSDPDHEKRMRVDGAGHIYFMAMVEGSNESRNELICLVPPAVNGQDPEIKWAKEINSMVSEPALHEDTLYYCTNDSRLHAVNTGDGSHKWEFYVDAEGKAMANRAPAVAADGRIFFSMGSIVGVARDEGAAGALLGQCKLPSKHIADSATGPVSQLGPRGEFYVGYKDVHHNRWLAKVVDRNFAPRPGAIEINAGDWRPPWFW